MVRVLYRNRLKNRLDTRSFSPRLLVRPRKPQGVFFGLHNTSGEKKTGCKTDFSTYFGVIAVLLCLLSVSCFGEVKVAVNVNGSELSEGVPFYPRISISRDTGVDIDVSSFRMEGQSLDVEFLGDAQHTSVMTINGVTTETRLTISTYRFRMEGRGSGLHVIPPISVSVAGRIYQSPKTAYSISTAQVKTSTFRLESAIEAEEPVFPGQRVAVIYRIYYQQDIETTLRQLPIFTEPAFRAVGGQEVENYRSGGFYVQEIKQELEALLPGEYRIGPAVIEGYVYEQDFFGRRILKKPRLRTEAETLTLEVKAFPGEGRPPSFNGAVGDFSIQAKLLSSYQVSVGDKLDLEVTLYGEGQVEGLSLPDIGSQSKFQGRFRFSDLPPAGEVEGKAKKFVVELRPLSADIESIPPIEFSFFDPRSRSYRTVRSNPIAITVQNLEGDKSRSRPWQEREAGSSNGEKTLKEEGATLPNTGTWDEGFGRAGSIVIQGNYRLSEDDFSLRLLQRPQLLVVVPLALVLVLMQAMAKKRRSFPQEAKSRRNKSSRELFRDALLAQGDPDRFYPTLEQAFLLRLKEKGLISEKLSNMGDLPRGGIVGDVRTLLSMLEAQRFSGKKLLTADQVVERVHKLFERIK